MRTRNLISCLLAGAVAALLAALTLALLALVGSRIPLLLTPVLPAFAAGVAGMAGVTLGWRLSGRTGGSPRNVVFVAFGLSIATALICGSLVGPLDSRSTTGEAALQAQVFFTLAAIGLALPTGGTIGLHGKRRGALRARLAVAVGPLYGLAFGVGFGFAFSRAYIPCSSPSICFGPNIGYVFGLVFGPIFGLWLGIVLWLALSIAGRVWLRGEPAVA